MVVIVLTFVLIGVLFAALARSCRRFFLFQLVFFPLNIAFVSYAVFFGIAPGYTLAMLLVNTTPEEVRGFIGISQGKWLIVLLVALVASYIWFALKLPRTLTFAEGSRASRRWALVFLLMLSAYAAGNPAELIDGIALNPTAGSLIFLGGWIPKATAEMRGSRVRKIPYHATRTGGEEVHVLIIGESERRASWSVYGYGRATTPYMEKLKGEAIFLSNATADANLTEWAVPIIMTGLTPEEYDISRVRGNLIDLAKEAGYETAWLDNQDIGIATAIGVTATRTVNPPDFHADSNGRHSFDEELLPAYGDEIARAGIPRFIGIHMMGAHWEYYRRYPPTFQHFGTSKDLSMLSIFYGSQRSFSEVVDSYDNAVLYTDWFLHQIIEKVRDLTVPATVMFLSDHGEDLQSLDGDSGHGQPIYTPHAFNIPAFVWVNAAYRAAHPDLVRALQANASEEFRSHNVFDTEADLMGITWPGAHSSRSLASEHFVPDKTMKRVAGGVLVNGP